MRKPNITKAQQEYFDAEFEEDSFQPEGWFKNGDFWDGSRVEEEGEWWFGAIDKNGIRYETREIPYTPPLFTMTQFIGHWTEEQVKSYLAAGEEDIETMWEYEDYHNE